MRTTRNCRIAHALTLALMASFAVACSDGEEVVGLDSSEYELLIVSGNNQNGLAGTVMQEPLVVQVRHIGSGASLPGVTVNWSVVKGGGEPTRATSATDENGWATTRVVLSRTFNDRSAIDVDVAAATRGLKRVIFDIVVSELPVLRSVSPTSADPGDIVEIGLSNLQFGYPVQILFDGVAGEIVSRTNGSQGLISAVVPQPAGVCSDAVQSVKVWARVGGLTTGSINLNVSVPEDPFQIGQVLIIESDEELDCVQLPADGGGAKYLVVALSAEFEADGLFEVKLSSGNVVVAGANQTAPQGRSDFHGWLRDLEGELAGRGLSKVQPTFSGQLFADPVPGEEKNFRVLNNVNITGRSLRESDFDVITSTLEYVGDHTLIYVDQAAPEPGLRPADIKRLGDAYDRWLYDAGRDFFGEPSDVDGNGRVILLLSPTVNGLSQRGSGTIVTGFFFPLDLFSLFDCGTCVFSNAADLMYGLVPDPDGEFSDPRSLERVMDLLPTVMAHETQHLISFNYRIEQNAPPEVRWLAESMAHAAEEIGADALNDGGGPVEMTEVLYAANFGRLVVYLEMPSAHSLTAVTGYGGLAERGAGWLFLRWISEQYGDFILRDLTQARSTGVANIEEQTGEPFFRLFADWTVALWAEDLDIPGLPQRYQIPKWPLRSVLQVGEPPAYPLRPMRWTFSNFRATGPVSQFIAASSPFHLLLDAAGDTENLQIDLEASARSGLAILRYE